LHERYLLDALAVHVEQLAEVGRSRGEAAAQERAYLVKANVGITVLLDRRKATRHFRCVLLQFFLNEPVLRRVHRVVDKCPRRNL
jgi:hypothetical protein